MNRACEYVIPSTHSLAWNGGPHLARTKARLALMHSTFPTDARTQVPL